MNDKIEELYNNLDAKDKIINEQVLEIARLKERFERLVQEHIDTITRNEEKQQRIDKAKEYIKTSINNPQPFYKYLYGDENGNVQNLEKLLEILGDKENE